VNGFRGGQIVASGDGRRVIRGAGIAGRRKDLGARVLRQLPDQGVLASAASDYKYSQ
jgi:hypothetical protein